MQPEPSPPLPTLAPDQTKIKQQQGKRKPSVSSVKEFCKPGGSSTSKKDGKTNTYGSCRPSASAAAASEAVHEAVEGIASASIPAPSMLSSSNGKTNVTDFGQTFPTPRESTAVACSTSTMSVEEASAASAATNSVEKRFPSEKKAHRSNNLVPSNATNAATSVKSRKPHRSPLSYYLPLPKKHSLIKDARLRSHSQDNNKENKAPNRLSEEPEPEQVEKEPLSLQVRILDLIGWSLSKKSVDFSKLS